MGQSKIFIQLAVLALLLNNTFALAQVDKDIQESSQINRETWGIKATRKAISELSEKNIQSHGKINISSDGLPIEISSYISNMQIEKTNIVELVQKMYFKKKSIRTIKDIQKRKIYKLDYEMQMSELANEARRKFILRSIYSQDQLCEQMVWFWMNHFNVYSNRRDIRAMVGNYEQTLRDNAFGKFREILEATLRHPAMLRYLDNDRNSVGRMNENYARELMELHSMGVGAGYSQNDVQALARILTGVGVRVGSDSPRLKPELESLYVRSGLFEFDPERHDFGKKRFLGSVIKGRGWDEVEQALDLIAASPATARHVSTQIAIYFMGENPADAVIQEMTNEFQRSEGSIGAVLRTMMVHPEYTASIGKSFKNPVQYTISAIRITYGDRIILNVQPVVNWIRNMGASLYARQTPDGYGINSSAWSGPGQMAARFDVAREIGSGGGLLFGSPARAATDEQIPDIRRNVYESNYRYLISEHTRSVLAKADGKKEWNILFLSSPEFMHR